MTHFSITVPDNKASFFKELINNLSFVTVEQTGNYEFSEAHKEILDHRLENYHNNPDSFLNWEMVQNEIENRNEL